MRASEAEARKRHRRDLPALSRTLFQLIDELVERGKRAEDTEWQRMWEEAVVTHSKRFQWWLRLKDQHRTLKHVRPSHEHWVRLFNFDPKGHKNSSKYLLNPKKERIGVSLRKSFVGLNFVQVEEASRILQTHFKYAPEAALPAFNDETTWGRVFDLALATVKRANALVPTVTEATGQPLPTFDVSKISHLPIRVPRHFLGREAELSAIRNVLNSQPGQIVIYALHGLRGVGKTALAAAYAHTHRIQYHVTWWIDAGNESSMIRDLSSLGARLGLAESTARDSVYARLVLDKLRDSDNRSLLIYDNANDRDALVRYLPTGGDCKVIVTSNAHNWSGLAQSIEIQIWPDDIGHNYLVSYKGKNDEHRSAQELAHLLGGLPLALEQAAAYCERLGVTLSAYCTQFRNAPETLLDTPKDAPLDYYNRLTVSKTFDLAIREAVKLHPAAELIIFCAALLPSERIPVALFRDGLPTLAQRVGIEPGDGSVDEAIAALRAFSLARVDDEAEKCIHMHPLVRQIAKSRWQGEPYTNAVLGLIEVLGGMFLAEEPGVTYWSHSADLDGVAVQLISDHMDLMPSSGRSGITLLRLISRHRAPLQFYSNPIELARSALSLARDAINLDPELISECAANLAEVLMLRSEVETKALKEAMYARYGEIAERDGQCSWDTDGFRYWPRALGTFGYLQLAASVLHSVLDHDGLTSSLSKSARETLEDLLQEVPDRTERGYSLRNAQFQMVQQLEDQEEKLGPTSYHLSPLLVGLGFVLDELAAHKFFINFYIPNYTGHGHVVDGDAGYANGMTDLTWARSYFERALAIEKAEFGLDYPFVGIILQSLGAILTTLDDHELASACFLLVSRIKREKTYLKYHMAGPQVRALDHRIRYLQFISDNRIP